VRWGGHVAKNLGDGLLVYFGWPSAREDDPERAVRAGLAMLEAMVPLNATLGARDGTRLAVRIGMDTGRVVVADGGEVFGETANVAARAQSAAEPDTVVITAATQRLVAGMFAIEDLGPQALKGVREPVTLYRVVQPSGVRSRLAVAAGRLTRFVGREVELATLVERWEQARDGAGQTLVVLGEAGVGSPGSPTSCAIASRPFRIRGSNAVRRRTPWARPSTRSSRWWRRGSRSYPRTRRPRSSRRSNAGSVDSPRRRRWRCSRTSSVFRRPHGSS
jgi:hypothetical protein